MEETVVKGKTQKDLTIRLKGGNVVGFASFFEFFDSLMNKLVCCFPLPSQAGDLASIWVEW